MQRAEKAIPNAKSDTPYFISAPEPLNLAARSFFETFDMLAAGRVIQCLHCRLSCARYIHLLQLNLQVVKLGEIECFSEVATPDAGAASWGWQCHSDGVTPGPLTG